MVSEIPKVFVYRIYSVTFLYNCIDNNIILKPKYSKNDIHNCYICYQILIKL